MKWSTLRYLFKEGIVGLWRNRTMAIASMGTIILCLMILGMSYAIGTNIDYMIEQMELKFGVTAYLEDEITEEELQVLKGKIEGLTEVKSITYISKDDALQTFSEENENANLFAMFKEDNPLPASFEIITHDIKDQSKLVGILETYEGIDDTIYFENETQTFINIRNTVNYVCYGIMICLVIVGLMLMSNTIKLTVYVRRREINIMKYVGATDAFIRVPFIIEGVVIGLIGALLSIGLVAGSYYAISNKASSIVGVLGGLNLVSTSSIVGALVPMFIALGIGIGFVGSIVAIRRHLNV